MSESGTATSAHWDLEIRPRLTPIFAWITAIVVVTVHIAIGLLLKVGTTGVVFQTADQIAIANVGVVVGACVLLLTRPRLRVGPAGLAVRNLFAYRIIPWPDVAGVSFPRGARWARVDLPDDEYVPVLAIQAVDKERAVDAIENVRRLMRSYRPDLDRP